MTRNLAGDFAYVALVDNDAGALEYVATGETLGSRKNGGERACLQIRDAMAPALKNDRERAAAVCGARAGWAAACDWLLSLDPEYVERMRGTRRAGEIGPTIADRGRIL